MKRLFVTMCDIVVVTLTPVVEICRDVILYFHKKRCDCHKDQG